MIPRLFRSCFAAAALALAGPLSVLALASPPGQEVVELPERDRPLDATFEEVYRVGAPDVLFSQITYGEFAPDGTLYVHDAVPGGMFGSIRLLAVREDGRKVREIGGQGEGPGEFQALIHSAVLPDGGVAAFDVGSNAYQIFDADGNYDRTVRMDGTPRITIGTIGARTTRADRTGDGLISYKVLDLEVQSPDAVELTMGGGRTIERIRLDGEEAEITSVLSLWAPPRDEGTEIEVERGLSMNMGRVFEPVASFDVLAGGMIAFSDSSAYAVKIAGGDGTIMRILRRPFAPEPVSGRMQERAKEAMRAEIEDNEEFAAMRDMMAPVIDQMLAQMRFYHEVPVVAAVKAGWENAIWVRRADDTAWDEDLQGPIDVVTVGGEYRGTFAPEDLSMPLALGPGGLAAFVELDDLDVPTVVVRRLPPELR